MIQRVKSLPKIGPGSPDDGYSTDSRANTTPPLSPLLTPSRSSLTAEAPPGLEAVTRLRSQNNSNMYNHWSQSSTQLPGQIQKVPYTKKHILKSQETPVKRRDAKVDKSESKSSLEDQLRALAVIEEEGNSITSGYQDRNLLDGKSIEAGHNGCTTITTSKDNPVPFHKHSKADLREMINTEIFHGQGDTRQISGFYRALPISIKSSTNSHKSWDHLSAPVSQPIVFPSNLNTRNGLTVRNDFPKRSSSVNDVLVASVPIFSTPQDTSSNAIYKNAKSQNVKVPVNFGKEVVLETREYFSESDRTVNEEELGEYVFLNANMDAGYQRNLYLKNSPESPRYKHVPTLNTVSISSRQHSSVHSQYQPQHIPSHHSFQNFQQIIPQNSGYIPPKLETSAVDLQQYSNTNIPRQDHGRHSISHSHPTLTKRISPSFSSNPAPHSSAQDRTSWHPGLVFEQQQRQRFTPSGLDRYSVDLGNMNHLQRQHYAAPELYTQSPDRRMFASSAEIHQLFSGKPKISLSGSVTSLDDVKESLCTQCLPSSVAVSNTEELTHSFLNSATPKTSFRALAPSTSLPGVPQHATSITNHSLPESYSLSTIQNQPGPSFVCTTYENAGPRLDETLTTEGELNADKLYVNCLSSGYSSESELQQIESNAETAKNQYRTQETQNFTPLSTSYDRDSNTGHENAEEEHVYANQPRLPQTDPSLHYINQVSAQSSYRLQDQQDPLINHPERTHLTTPSSQNQILSTLANRLSEPQNHRQLSIVNPNFATHYPNSSEFYRYSNPELRTDTNNFRQMGLNSNLSENTDVHYSSRLGDRVSPAFTTSTSYSVMHNSSQRRPVLEDPRSFTLTPCSDPSPSWNRGCIQREGQTADAPFPPFDPTRLLEIPFETTIISDEKGDRLSTLV